MPSLSRRSAAVSAGLVAITISTSVPSSGVVSAWVAPLATGAGYRSTGKGVVRPRSGMEGAAAPQSGAPCRCGNTRRSSVSMLSTDDEREGGNNAPISEHGRSPSSPWLGDGPSSALETLKQAGIGMLAGMFVLSGAGGDVAAALAEGGGAGITAPTSSVTVQDLQRYDGFEDYAAQGQQMENSDVGCFANECKRETASCFTDGSCLKGVTCLGRCKGEQECATRCFAQYGSNKLDSWLTCTLEDHSCVKIPKDMDFSAIDRDPPHILKGFDAKQLQGTWYKVMGVNQKYDCFDCQKNTFAVAQVGDSGAKEQGGTGQVADIKVNFRLAKPDSEDFWENTITERLQVDPAGSPRTFHTDGKLFGLSFKENWYVTGQSTEPGAEFIFVQYKGHTLQGSYAGGFVYSRRPTLPTAAVPHVARVAREHGIDPASMIPIDNTCSLRSSLPRAGDTRSMGVFERLRYEASFVYDLMEWVHPGTIHEYAKADQKKNTLEQSQTVANAGGVSSSLKAGSRSALDGDDG